MNKRKSVIFYFLFLFLPSQVQANTLPTIDTSCIPEKMMQKKINLREFGFPNGPLPIALLIMAIRTDDMSFDISIDQKDIDFLKVTAPLNSSRPYTRKELLTAIFNAAHSQGLSIEKTEKCTFYFFKPPRKN